MKRPSLSIIKIISKIFLFLLMLVQRHLVIKYGMAWWEFTLTAILVLCAVWLIRIYSMTDGMIHTVIKTDFYNKLKQTLFNNDKRNTDELN